MSDELQDGVTRRKFLAVTGQSIVAAGLVGGLSWRHCRQRASAHRLTQLPTRLAPVQAPIPLPPDISAPPNKPPARRPSRCRWVKKSASPSSVSATWRCSKFCPALRNQSSAKSRLSSAATALKRCKSPPSTASLKKSVYSYADFDQIASNPDVQVVYVVLPNALHEEYVVRAGESRQARSLRKADGDQSR